MRTKWADIKEVISAYGHQKDIFLSMIDQEGEIICANANMLKTFQLKTPRHEKINFFDLLHPVNVNHFKDAMQISIVDGKPCAMELYVKNGYYHPMKWEVNYLQVENGGAGKYLCVGHRVAGDERLKKINQLDEKNYQLIFEGLNTCVFFLDKSGELITASQKAAEIFGITLEKLQQVTDIESQWNKVWDVRTEYGAPVAFNKTPFMKAIQTRQPQTGILVIGLGNGETRWLHVSAQPIFEENNPEPYAVMSNIADLTAEKKLSNQLRDRETLFNMFMDHTPNMAWVVDEGATLVFANQSFLSYFRLDEKESINKRITDIVPPVVSKALYEKHATVLKTGSPIDIVEKVKWADGTDFIFHINIFPVEGLAGKKLLGGYAVNLADKFAIENQLKEVNDRLLLLTRTTSDAIWEWDMQTGCIFRNDALMDLIGYQKENARGLSWWLRRIHPEDRNRISDKVRDTTEKNLHSWVDEYRFKCSDGTYKHMHDKGYIVYENGLPVKMIGSLQDISELKELENRLVEERFNRQKEISETIIKAQEKERTRIGYELHDNVNQLLSTSKLFVDLLGPVSKEEKDIKKKSLEYITMAIEEIRKLSKELVMPQLGDKGLVETINSTIYDTQLSSNIKIKFVHDGENDILMPGKKITLFRIIQEQLKNIIKHSKASRVDISLLTNEKNVQLLIKDNGKGFDLKQTHRGIGLSNIYERTRFYNGTVEIDTATNKGCVITVTMPLV